MIANYYLILLELSVVLAFVVVFKLGHIYLMAVVSRWFTDDDDLPTQDPATPGSRHGAPPAKKEGRDRPPAGRRLLWYGLATLTLGASVLQIHPALVAVSYPQVMDLLRFSHQPSWLRPLVSATARFWVSDALWNNILSVILQASIGLLLLAGDRWLGRVGLALATLWGLVLWVFWEGFGGIFSGIGGVAGAPGAGLLYAVIAALLFVPARVFERKGAEWLRSILTGFFLLTAIAQALPGSGLWMSGGLGMVSGEMPGHPWRHPPGTSFLLHSAAAHPLEWNAIFILVPAALGISTWILGASKWTLSAALAWAAFTWWFGQALGFVSAAGLEIGVSPFIALLSWAHFAASKAKVRRMDLAA